MLGLLSGCGDEDTRAEIDDAAALTAQAITDGDFSSVPLASGSPDTLASAAENLHEPFDGLLPEVEVERTEVQEPEEDSVRPPTATVSFDHVWDLAEMGIDGEQWSYATEAEYTYDEESDTWLLEGETELLLPDYVGHENIGIVTTSAERGRIMDDLGRAMVYNRDVVRLGIDKTQLEGDPPSEETQREAAVQLAEAVGIDPQNYAETVLAYGDEAFVEAITVRRDSSDVTAEDIEGIPGAVAQPDQMSLADRRDFAPLLLGRVGPVTAEHLERDPALDIGEMVGTSGLQASHQETLRGVPGMRIHLGEETLYSIDPQPGADVHTSLNPRLQDLAQQIVSDQEVTAGLVVIRPSDGGILAAASHTEGDSYVETATQSTYAPGSTFKLVTALAMLRDGLSPESTVACPNNVTVHGQVFGNVPGYRSEFLGDIPFHDAISVSCNTAFAAAWDDVTSAEVHQAALDLGLDNNTRIGVPSRMAEIPDDSTLNLHAANLFGQGMVETSTLGMATVAASIGAGHTVHPHLVVPEDQDDSVEDSEEDPPAGELSQEEAEDLRALMYDTVTYGTLQHMDPVPGDHVYAKTGTAEAGDDDDAYAHTWVTALQGDLAVAIFLEEGEFGGSTNGPLLHEFLTGAQQILDEQSD